MAEGANTRTTQPHTFWAKWKSNGWAMNNGYWRLDIGTSTENGWPLTVAVGNERERADAVTLCIFHSLCDLRPPSDLLVKTVTGSTQSTQPPLAAPRTPPPPLRCRIGRYVAVWDPASCSMSGLVPSRWTVPFKAPAPLTRSVPASAHNE